MALAFSENDKRGGLSLVLLHAFPLNRRMWKHQLSGLNDTIHAVAPDLPGFGESEALSEPPSMKAYVNSLLDFLDERGISSAVFGGCSMGGYILFEFWRTAPERVKGLVLCDTRAEADAPEMRERRRQSIEEVRSLGTAPLAETMLPRLVCPVTYQNSRHLIDDLTKDILGNSREGIANALQALADRPDSTETLKSVSVPVLILVGAEDGLTPPSVAQAMQENLPKSHYAIIPDAGHLSPLEQPESVNSALRIFLIEAGLI